MNIANIAKKLDNIQNTIESNLLDEIMFEFGLDDGTRYHEPEIYYKPQYKPEFNVTIFDPNFFSWIGNIAKEDFMTYFKVNNIEIDAVMKQISEKYMYINKHDTKILETPTLENFLDLLFSAKKLYCLTSGTATLAPAINKPVTVLFGKGHQSAFRHSKNNEYIQIPNYFRNKIKRFLKRKIKQI